MAGPTVLIIDDDTFMRRIIRQTLLSIGCDQVTDVASATEALVLLGRGHFDLILSDIYMPGMTGLELLKLVRTGKAVVSRDSRFIALTSFSNSEVFSASMLLDVNGFLVKPINADLVKKKMLRALKETMYLRPEADYEAIKLDTGWVSREKKRLISVGGEASVQRPDPLVVADEPRVEMVSVLQLPTGAVLAENLFTKDGTLLLSLGQKLTLQLINRLQDLHSILNSDIVKIRVEEGQSEQA